jgi:hypothetical protein
MALPTFSFAADATSGAPGGEYVAAGVAQQLEQTLSKLVWHVLYGKSHEASGVAVDAEQILAEIKRAKLA